MNKIELSKFISLILRHKPDIVGICLDEHGWASVNALISGINRTGKYIDIKLLEDIVDTDDKNRYSFNDDKTKIRANQGHSVCVNVELRECVPPDTLYHGTAIRFVNNIMSEGIKPMSRLYVHLSADIDTAISVGKRHGEHTVLTIDTKRMVSDGIKFYLSQNGVWLTKFVDWKYITSLSLG